MIKLGDKVKDAVSGLTGIATGRIEYLNGCVQYLVTPPVDKEGKRVEGTWMDVQQLRVVKAGAVQVEPLRTGGPSSNAPQRYGA